MSNINSVNHKKLRELIEKKGLKYVYLSEQLGMTTQSLQRKIDGVFDFKLNEVKKLIEILGLTWEKDINLIREIFLCSL